MSPLNIHPEELAPVSKKKSNKTLKAFLGIGVLVAIPVIGSTFAATININSSGTVQFAQGSSATAACDTALTTAATSSYLTVSSTTAFYLKTITISDIDLTSGCEGKTLVLSVDSSNSEVDISTGVKQVSFTIPATAGSSTTALTNVTSGFTAAMSNSSGAAYKTDSVAVPYDEAGKIVVTITSPILASSSVTKFLVQSS
jgi:hypothetical protein